MRPVEEPGEHAGTAETDPGAARPDAATAKTGGGHRPAFIGHYRLIHRIGRGGMGEVWEAFDERLGRCVAIKTMRPSSASAEAVDRFRHESQLLARLQEHDEIVSIYHADTYTDESGKECPYFVMELVRNAKHITDYCEEHGLTIRQRLELLERACRIVGLAHDKDIIHRDLKPSNILIDGDGQIRIIDFGIARAMDTDLQLARSGPEGWGIRGTVAYMSPEQCDGDPRALDARGDVYALGVVAYEVLCGKTPYDISDRNTADAIDVIRSREPDRTPLRTRGIKGYIAAVLCKALRKRRGERFVSASEMAEALRNAHEGRPVDLDMVRPLARFHKLRAVCRRQPFATACFAAVMACTTIFASLLFAGQFWLPLYRLHERAAVALQPSAEIQELSGVKLILLTDDTDIDALAEREGLDGVSESNLVSWRALHGRLMERLANAGARVVGWDIKFTGDTPYDVAFADGARALRDRDTEVVVAMPTWSLDTDALPTWLSHEIATSTRWGGITIGISPDLTWRIDVAVHRAQSEVYIPSLVAAMFAPVRAPGAHPEFSLVRDSRLLRIKSVQGREYSDDSESLTAETDVIELAAVLPLEHGDPRLGLNKGDTIAVVTLPIPPDEAILRSAHEYSEIFEADATRLRKWFAGKAVVIGNVRSDAGDRHPHPGGRFVPGCYGIAAALGSLLSLQSVRYAAHNQLLLFTIGGSVAGVALWRLSARGRAALCAAAWAVVAAGFVAATILAYRHWAYLINPAPPLTAMTAVLVICAVVGILRPDPLDTVPARARAHR